MDPTIFEQISKKIDEISALLDTAEARAMDNGEVRSKQLLSAKLHSASGTVLETLNDRPTLYADRLDRKQLEDLLNLYKKIPTLTTKLETCINKTKGWRIGTGHQISAYVRRFYGLLGADVAYMPDLRTIHDVLVAIFKKGKRKPKNGGNNTDSNTDTNDQGTSDTNATDDTKPEA